MAVPGRTSVSLKLLIYPKSNTLLFAEAGKKFVDFLFNIMSLPVATVITLLGKQGTVGCTGNIYESIENLDGSFMLSTDKKDILLKPVVANYDASVARLLPRPVSSSHTNLYRCDGNSTEHCRKYVANDSDTKCPSCPIGLMQHTVTFVNQTSKPSYSGGVGFVKGAATFIVMDNLVVRPMSTEYILTLFNKANIKDMSDLEVKVVDVGVNEAVELLRALMQSKTVLTTVFLGGKKDLSIKSEPI